MSFNIEDDLACHLKKTRGNKSTIINDLLREYFLPRSKKLLDKTIMLQEIELDALRYLKKQKQKEKIE
jgi:hypothetical protein